MKAVVKESKHKDFGWEVYAPFKMFGRRIQKGFVKKADAVRHRNELNNDFENNQIAPLDPKVHLLVSRYQGDLSLEQIEQALQDALVKSKQCTMRLSEAAAHHLADLQKLLKRKACSESYEHDYRVKFPAVIKNLGDPRLPEISKAMLDDFVNEQLELDGMYEGTTKSPRTIKNYIDMLSTVLNHSIRQDWISTNVTHQIKLASYSPEVHILKPQEIVRLLDNASWLMRNWIMFSCFGGARSSEARIIKWEDVRLEDNEFLIDGQKNVGARRYVQLTPPLRAYCEEMLTPPPNAAPGWKRTGLILRGYSYNGIAKHRHACEEAAGIKIKQNAMRHSYGSHHLMAFGDDTRTAMEMGHRSSQTTWTYYREAVSRRQANRYWKIRTEEAQEAPDNVIDGLAL